MNLLLYREIGQTADPISHQSLRPHSGTVPSDPAPHFQTEVGSPDSAPYFQTTVGSSDSASNLQAEIDTSDSASNFQTEVGSSDSMPSFQTKVGYFDSEHSPQTTVCSVTPSNPLDPAPPFPTKVASQVSSASGVLAATSLEPSDPTIPAASFPTEVASQASSASDALAATSLGPSDPTIPAASFPIKVVFQTASHPSASASIVPEPLDLPDFGSAFRQHMSAKHNPKVYRASLAAWRLLAEGLALLGLPLPEVRFAPNGKPYFSDFGLQIPGFGLSNPNLSLNSTDFGLNYDAHGAFSSNPGLFFSLSHSESYAAVLLSTAPCGVDVECVRPEVSERLRDRCMHPAELAEGMDFFTAWTRKECIAKLDGSGLPAHPNQLDASDARYRNWFAKRITDRSGREYALSALSMNNDAFCLVVFA